MHGVMMMVEKRGLQVIHHAHLELIEDRDHTLLQNAHHLVGGPARLGKSEALVKVPRTQDRVQDHLLDVARDDLPTVRRQCPRETHANPYLHKKNHIVVVRVTDVKRMR